jgi:hypothetical protein
MVRLFYTGFRMEGMAKEEAKVNCLFVLISNDTLSSGQPRNLLLRQSHGRNTVSGPTMVYEQEPLVLHAMPCEVMRLSIPCRAGSFAN